MCHNKIIFWFPCYNNRALNKLKLQLYCSLSTKAANCNKNFLIEYLIIRLGYIFSNQVYVDLFKEIMKPLSIEKLVYYQFYGTV